MEQVITIRRRASSARGVAKRTIGRVVRDHVGDDNRQDSLLVLARESVLPNPKDLLGYTAVLCEAGLESWVEEAVHSPVLWGYETLSNLTDGTIVALEPTGGTNTLYRPESDHNAIFATGRCNSNCLMCSQPPSDWEPYDLVEEHLRTIDLILSAPSSLGITGGEPTLLGDGLGRILTRFRHRFPDTSVFMLTNGRTFADIDYAKTIADAGASRFVCGIPLYADVPSVHDYIVQAKGAYEETLRGIYNCARVGIQVEIRVVLHKLTIPRLTKLAEFIYRNLPFVGHIALMGLENMGYVKKNWEELWIDPVDYQLELEEAVKHLHYRHMNVSIYNHPLCVLPSSLHGFARQSISDFKNLYLEQCCECSKRDQCSGLFASSADRHSRGIAPFQQDTENNESAL
jgi:His-Xaa-Ser system radical SAM maturase HxsC